MPSDRAIRLLGVEGKDAYDFKKQIQSSSAPTVITTQEAERLIDYVVDESALWKIVNVIRMTQSSEWIRFINTSKGLLRRDSCGSYTDASGIEATGVKLEARKYKAVIPICDDILKDNLEGPALEEHLLRILASDLNNELEIIALMANASGWYNNPDVDNTILHEFDGWYEQLKGGNVIHPTAPHCCLDWCYFGQLFRKLATKYRSKPEQLRFFMAPDLELDYADILEKRQTGLGDDIITGRTVPGWMRTPFQTVPLLPVNLPNHCGTYEDGDTATFMFLSHPSNLVLGIQYEMEYERERDGKNSRTFHIFRISFDAKIVNVAATALMTGIVTKTSCCAPSSED